MQGTKKKMRSTRKIIINNALDAARLDTGMARERGARATVGGRGPAAEGARCG